MGETVDPVDRDKKKAWKEGERVRARAAFPLPDRELAALFGILAVELAARGCDDTRRLTDAWAQSRSHPLDALGAWLENNGGFCDCEVMANVAPHWEENRENTMRRRESGPRTAHVTLLEALSKGPPPEGNLAVPIFGHGSLEVEMYRPERIDSQTPHDRDEVYLVARGTSWFSDGERRYYIEVGSFVFVAAGQPHRFEEFSSDFACWVLFYGPRGGERLDL